MRRWFIFNYKIRYLIIWRRTHDFKTKNTFFFCNMVAEFVSFQRSLTVVWLFLGNSIGDATNGCRFLCVVVALAESHGPVPSPRLLLSFCPQLSKSKVWVTAYMSRRVPRMCWGWVAVQKKDATGLWEMEAAAVTKYQSQGTEPKSLIWCFITVFVLCPWIKCYTT